SLAVALLAGTAACGNTGSDPSSDAAAPSEASASEQDAAVTIRTFAFDPDPITVQAGTTVTWTNEDEILHTVTSGARGDADGAFDEKLDGPGSVAEHAFETPGTYAYHCSIHPGMDGVVEVS
ncbi:MAG: plastocyanin/azurin family copper-binding protein, partial [Actinomycetota bacterium]|nr:plastocyanin/azurin family copper-binding protein [Actinomycetota bacterium]